MKEYLYSAANAIFVKNGKKELEERSINLSVRSHKMLKDASTAAIDYRLTHRTTGETLTGVANKTASRFFLKERKAPPGWPMSGKVDIRLEFNVIPYVPDEELDLSSPVPRPSRDETGLGLARVWATRGTCGRRKVGCVLVDVDGWPIGSGFNGPAAGEPHCTEHPCPGRDLPSGEGLELCEAVHAEANALLRCVDVRRIHTCYSTTAPCLHCVKLLMNTSCERIVFAEDYPHAEAARQLWERRSVWRLGGDVTVFKHREWVKL